MARKAAATSVDPRKLRAILLSVLLSAVVLATLGTAFHQQIENQLNAWSLLPQPERLTELYFDDPNSLPATYIPAKLQQVSFTVHNLEYATTTYHYVVTESGDKSVTLAGGSFTLPQDGRKTIPLDLKPADAGTHARITVTLMNTDESIQYLVERQS